MSNTNNMSNRETINGVIAFLQASNNEDIALDLANAIVTMDLELERVKGIAGRRLDRIAQLQHQLAAVEDKLEDKLEDTRSELGREPRSHLENELADQRASAFRTADALQYIVNYCR